MGKRSLHGGPILSSDSGCRPQFVQIVSPLLHHLLTLLQVLRSIIGTPGVISLAVCKLHFNDIGWILLLIEQCRGHSPKPVNAHLVLIIAQTSQGIEKPHIEMHRDLL